MDSLPARNALARNASHTDASGSPAIAGGPNDPSDPNNGNNNNPPASPTGGPQPFGSGFNPHVNPVDPNNPYATQPPNPPARNASQSDAGGPNLPNIPNQDLLPKLYSGLQWDLTQRKILLFTSGKRRIEQEGVYMESAQIPDLPQEFINYYTAQLTEHGS